VGPSRQLGCQENATFSGSCASAPATCTSTPLLTVSLGKGSITHVINGAGDAALPSSVVPHNVVRYP